jgi:putative IMPACT (imprinted ancient) family translation regulator
MTHASNVAVVVTRWYGGIKLGPDRFKHIKNAARDVLERHGLISKK